ncbi:hypothetical protein OROMI_014562 [Orobanche minor]
MTILIKQINLITLKYSLSIEDINQCLLSDGVVLSDSPPKDSSSLSPDSGCDLSIEDIDQFLVNDELLLSDSPPKDSSSSPDSGVVQTDERLDVIESNGGDGTVEDDDDSDDPAAKQRKRKLRNKDAAMRSRERKKLYVHDLEMKSKFYEAECRRLGHLLQCCVAENQALQYSLHNSKVFDASVSRQESAVLLLDRTPAVGFPAWNTGHHMPPNTAQSASINSGSGSSAKRGKRVGKGRSKKGDK